MQLHTIPADCWSK